MMVFKGNHFGSCVLTAQANERLGKGWKMGKKVVLTSFSFIKLEKTYVMHTSFRTPFSPKDYISATGRL